MFGRKQIHPIKKCILLSIPPLNGQTDYRSALEMAAAHSHFPKLIQFRFCNLNLLGCVFNKSLFSVFLKLLLLFIIAFPSRDHVYNNRSLLIHWGSAKESDCTSATLVGRTLPEWTGLIKLWRLIPERKMKVLGAVPLLAMKKKKVFQRAESPP